MDSLPSISHDDAVELHARMSALELILRTHMANHFAQEREAFDAVMLALLRLTRQAPAPTGPTAPEAVQEVQARIATHLLRYQQAVHAIWHPSRPA